MWWLMKSFYNNFFVLFGVDKSLLLLLLFFLFWILFIFFWEKSINIIYRMVMNFWVKKKIYIKVIEYKVEVINICWVEGEFVYDDFILVDVYKVMINFEF